MTLHPGLSSPVRFYPVDCVFKNTESGFELVAHLASHSLQVIEVVRIEELINRVLPDLFFAPVLIETVHLTVEFAPAVP